MHRPVVVLPQPLSPTSPKVSPRPTVKSIPSTAFTSPTLRLMTIPSVTGKCIRSPLTSRSGLASISATAITLLVQPDRCQILVQIMARADLPALYVVSVGDDPIPPQHRELVRFGIDHVLLEFSHQTTLLGRIRLVEHCLVKLDFLWIVVISIILGINRARQDLLRVKQRVDHARTISFEHDVEIATAHCFEPRAGRHDALRCLEPDLAPFIDQPSPDIFIGLVDIP